MYINLGNEVTVKEDEIIGFFDLDNATVSKVSRNYLSASEKRSEVKSLTYDLPKTFIVCAKEKGENSVYLSQFSTSTLIKRINYKENF
jgi:hypothetical protein